MMQKFFFNYIYLFLAILLLCYTGYRSAHLSFTHDESFTFNSYVSNSVFEILSYKNLEPIIANNHPLNTLSMKFFGDLFGNSEFFLRLHSFLAHAIYILFTYLILKDIQSKMLVFLGFIALNFNPYLLDFFSLARGYALSISLMLVSIYYFINYLKQTKNIFIYLSMLFSILAVVANFALITFSAALIFVLEVYFIVKRGSLKLFIAKNIPLFIACAVLYFIYRGPIKILIDQNQLNFGGTEGLWTDTVFFSIFCYLYENPYLDTLMVLLKFIVVFTAINSVLIVCWQYKTKTLNNLSYITIIFFIILGSSVLNHLFFDGLYLKERFALFLVPLFFFSLLNVLFFMLMQGKIIKMVAYSLSILVTACVLITMSKINLSYYTTWKYDADTKKMLSILAKENPTKSPVRIGITWIFEPAINFYRQTESLTWLIPVNRNGINGDYDYFYVDKNDITSFDKRNKILVTTFPISGASFYKKIK